MRLNPTAECCWALREADESSVKRLSEELCISPITARFLAARGIACAREASIFLRPGLEQIPDPSSMPGMDAAVSCIGEALTSGRRIGIFGDYDVDGVTAAALLADFLKSLGHDPAVMLPERLERGYGIDAQAVDGLTRRGAKLIITVDNGIRATAAAARARELGIDLVVTDHHVPEGPLPDAAAIVNPKLIEGCSPFKDLSGCGVAFMLAIALRRSLRESGALPSPEPNLRELLDVVALGTIADIMPLTGINRVLTAFGLDELKRAKRPGLRALIEISGAWPQDMNPGIVTYRLAPRINAAGRMGSAARALGLLLTDDDREARSVARDLDRANGERQRLEERALREATRMIDVAGTVPDGIVVHSKGWHVGVIGIVAAKLVERYGRPAVVISLDPSPPRGSARSPEGIDLLGALSPCAGCLVQYGGHAQAAGLTIEQDMICDFTMHFTDACGRQGRSAGRPSLEIDACVAAGDIDEELVGELMTCAPFGVGNPEPVLALRGVTVTDARTVGGGHLKLSVSSGEGAFEAIGFNMADMMPAQSTAVDIAFTPQFNTWNGRTAIQLKIKDIANSS